MQNETDTSMKDAIDDLKEQIDSFEVSTDEIESEVKEFRDIHKKAKEALEKVESAINLIATESIKPSQEDLLRSAHQMSYGYVTGGLWRRYLFIIPIPRADKKELENKKEEEDDYRPLRFNPAYPYWLTGCGIHHANMVAYLPANEPLQLYWSDAYNIENQLFESIPFTERFPKPKWYVPA